MDISRKKKEKSQTSEEKLGITYVNIKKEIRDNGK